MQIIKEDGELATVLEDNELVIVDFTADWCGPCKHIAPFFEELSKKEEFQGIKFIKLDIDEAEEDASSYQVNAVPTFIAFKKGESVQRVTGASRDSILAALQALKN
mmetsp:Transcript_17357/g.34093  ORF Transcript_17357/g.34093 Transcript_17357/m.34093 type:complete len:106 (-) Transcript_17357:491-808(-)|eukprot:CAMPEP_0171501298 /NCGR_PEP_ID=MMETSP0958-20121227/9476_1 /TAXON_ID=87120 /ORGANISM="Aurantiochytrium limacinum, Strain ATCCMYA-1381" /LENGTH=105 /DNA_ID=CAMNT_0012036089 /DNA_START=303 /DNA_END=620 /DNA_ORIENTATION=+